MKRIIIIFWTVTGIILQAYCQDTTSFFYNKKWGTSKESRAEYIINEIKLAETRFILEITYNDGTLIYKGEYSSLYPEIMNGETYYYGKNGELVERGYFTNGYPDSLWYVLNPKTGSFDTLNYIGLKDIIKTFDEPTSFPETFVVVEVMPSFPSKDDETVTENFNDFREYIKSEAYYPMLARERKNQGSTSVTFTIGPDGNIYDIVLTNPKNKYFDFEAVRVIRNSPKWNPGLQENKPVPVRLRDYVGFYLE